jgi:hypothetical protein
MEEGYKVEAVIDTNVLVYDTMEDSSFHEDVRDKLYRLEKWVVPSVVLEEFALVLMQLKVKESFIRDKILEILLNEKTEIATLSKQHFIDSIDIISREKVSVNRLNDKLIVSVAKAKKSPIFTYDKEIKKQWKKTI